MNRDSDIAEDILLRLLLESFSADDSPSGPRFSPAADAEITALEELGSAPTSIDSSFEVSPPAALGNQAIDADYNPVFDPGDLFPVQPHFEALLKRRLRQEISHRPPLFPWEQGLQDYPDNLNTGAVSIWLDHLRTLSVPSSVPEEVLADLFNQCQQRVHDISQTGRRLVAAVESLFPDQPQTLEYVAGLVARPAYRSAQAQTLNQLDYATASPQQQVALAMLVAQGIFEALSLTVSAASPTQTQTWLTATGDLTVQATYRSAGPEPQLEVRALLPTGGRLLLNSPGETLGSERSTSGELVLQMAAEPGTAYRLEVGLGQAQAAPLSFQILVVAG
ncbi:MAG: hypothetical protein EA368_08715 [Leptolyngbya sp. DLM2.Bin27]|nr:MAG: hypothetical protein EA368_08715 [Leptolyngbya sp. DLM2.Bin27]